MVEHMRGALHKAISDLKAKEFEFASNDVKIRFDLSRDEAGLLLESLDIRQKVKAIPELEKLKERDTAKEPSLAEWSEQYEGALDEYRCPECGSHIDQLDNFCRDCGQRIEWKRSMSWNEVKEGVKAGFCYKADICTDGFCKEEQCILFKAIEALEVMEERDEAKAVIVYTKDDMEFEHYECPACKIILQQRLKGTHTPIHKYERCPDCNQKIDWAE